MAKNLNNLPPGCASDDGGLDHAFEDAINELTEKIPNTETARALVELISGVQAIGTKYWDMGYDAGVSDEKERQADQATEVKSKTDDG